MNQSLKNSLIMLAIVTTLGFGTWLVQNIHAMSIEQVVIEHQVEGIRSTQDVIINKLDELGAR